MGQIKLHQVKKLLLLTVLPIILSVGILSILLMTNACAQSADACAALSSSSVASKFTISILTNSPSPFVWPGTSPPVPATQTSPGTFLPPIGYTPNPQLGPPILDPAFQPQLNAACTNQLASFAASTEYASAATNCQKQCTRNNSPTLQCSGTPTLSCKIFNGAPSVTCSQIPSIGPVGSTQRVYRCSVPAAIILTCTCAGNGGGGQ